MPGAVVDQRVRVVPQVPGDGVQVPPKRTEFVPVKRHKVVRKVY
jgi:hypothetical protein